MIAITSFADRIALEREILMAVCWSPKTARKSLPVTARFLMQLAVLFGLTTWATPGALGAESALELIIIDPHHQSIAELAPGEERTVVFSIENNGEAEIRILDLTTADDGMLLHSDDCEIPPGESGIITAMVTADQAVGPWWVRGKVLVRWNAPDGSAVEAEHAIAVAGFVNSAYEPAENVLDLGVIDPKTGGAFDMRLTSREVPKLEIRKLDIPEGLSVEPIVIPDDPQTLMLRVGVAAGMDQGTLEAEIVVHTNVERQPEVRVRCRGHVYGEIRPSPLPVRFWRSEGYIFGAFELKDKKQRPMTISKIESSPPGMVLLGQKPCGQAPAGCVHIEVSPREMRPLAPDGTIDVFLEDGPRVRVPFVMKSGSPLRPHELLTFLRSTELARTQNQSTDGGSALRWEVESDTGVFAYIVYRASQRYGPFVRINPLLIPARGTDPGEKSAYQFTDRNTDEGTDYFYYVDSVLIDGHRQQLTGVVKKTSSTKNDEGAR
jgi:hypothetical protein